MTDMVASTELVCRLGDERFADVVDRHDRYLTDTITSGQGTLIQNSGDGVLAMFESAGDAMKWGLEMAATMPQVAGVEIRVGAHCGPVLVRASRHVGRALHVVSRLTDLAEPSSMMTSLELLLASGRSPSDGLGRVRLRGVPESIDVVSVKGSEQAKTREVADALPPLGAPTRAVAMAIA